MQALPYGGNVIGYQQYSQSYAPGPGAPPAGPAGPSGGAGPRPTQIPPHIDIDSGSRGPVVSQTPYRFSLEVAQQPVRARMCGFGDKDRRQITPPPCVRLHVFDAATGDEVADVSNLDISLYALNVELWSPDEMVNMSLVLPNGQIHHQASSSSQVAAGSVSAIIPAKNLIGTLVATGFRLHDLHDQLGIWFVLQDLSIRTEGEYKLKFSFVNLADCFNPASEHGSAPVLTTAFSSTFRSYSAKKFPGVIDSTELSKCFAVQGIKIPIRRDAKGKKRKEEEE